MKRAPIVGRTLWLALPLLASCAASQKEQPVSSQPPPPPPPTEQSVTQDAIAAPATEPEAAAPAPQRNEEAVMVERKESAPMAKLAAKKDSAKQGAPAASVASAPSPAPMVAADTEVAVASEQYEAVAENAYLSPKINAFSTFSIDVDTAAYSNARRYLTNGSLPPKDAVRIEEFVNYFDYNYPPPMGKEPFSINTEIATCPWNPAHRLAMIGLQGRKMDAGQLPAFNLTFLLDTSGSMGDANKLPLLKEAFKLLVAEMRPQDKIAIVTYAGSAGLVLPPTSGNNKAAIVAALDNLGAGGSTAGGAGIQLAYDTASANLVKGGNNRVILATDGDFNVGLSDNAGLTKLIEEKRALGIFLTVLGFGMGNYKDARMEMLADKGNGNYAYIDTLREAKKVLVTQLTGTLFTIAKDVKLQIEFNPAKVKGYRLVGYENRMLKKEDFEDDKKDAGELGAGHVVTAFYEIIPAGAQEKVVGEEGKVEHAAQSFSGANSDKLMMVNLRYKQPKEDKSQLITQTTSDSQVAVAKSSENFRFGTAVAELALLLRDSSHKGKANYANVIERAKSGLGKDAYGYRAEFVELAEKAKRLAAAAGR